MTESEDFDGFGFVLDVTDDAKNADPVAPQSLLFAVQSLAEPAWIVEREHASSQVADDGCLS